MSDDELEDWSVVEQDDWTVDKPAAEILTMNAEKADRLNGYMKNQYYRTVVQVNFKNLEFFQFSTKQLKQCTWHYKKHTQHWQFTCSNMQLNSLYMSYISYMIHLLYRLLIPKPIALCCLCLVK